MAARRRGGFTLEKSKHESKEENDASNTKATTGPCLPTRERLEHANDESNRDAETNTIINASLDTMDEADIHEAHPRNVPSATSLSRSHFPKYIKPKIGPAYQCAVPKFVPPNASSTSKGDPKDAANTGNSSESVSEGVVIGGNSDPNSKNDPTGTVGRGGRGRGPGKGGRGNGVGRRGRNSGGNGGKYGTRGSFSEEATYARQSSLTTVEESIASGECTPITIANAAAEYLQHNFGQRVIPKGGLCVHRPLSHTRAKTSLSLSAFDDYEAPLDPQEQFLTFSRNIFMQTPRPIVETNIDSTWDSAAEQKFGGFSISLEKGHVKRKALGVKRKAASIDSSNRDGESLHKSAGINQLERPLSPTESLPDGHATHVNDVGLSTAQQNSSSLLPLCGMEDDEHMLAFLQTTHRGDIPRAKLSIMINTDQGYGVRVRKQLRKKRKDDDAAYPNPTTFTSESWRFRLHRARSTMLGDLRASCPPKYQYFHPTSIATSDLIATRQPWRWQHFDNTVEHGDRKALKRTRSGSISWSSEEIEKAKKIWKSILAYTSDVIRKIKESGEESNLAKIKSRPMISDLLQLVGKAHALPTPEEAFGRRDPSARVMSQNMNSIIDAIESGRDFTAQLLLCLNDNGDGIDLDALRKNIDEMERSCPIRIPEIGAVRKLVDEAALWEEKLESHVDYDTDSDLSDGDIVLEKKHTLDKVEKLISKGKDLTLRPRSLVRLESRVERAHVLKRRINVWNEARNQENPQNMKFISSLIKEANRIDLMFPEIHTLTGVHKKAEEWIDRASIALRTKISFKELESLVSIGESLPLNVSDILEKLQGRLKQAREWVTSVYSIVPSKESQFSWLKRVRSALRNNDKCSRLLSLVSEGSRIPVDIDCLKLLQIEIDARNWSNKTKLWLPQRAENSDDKYTLQKRAKIDDIRDHLDRAASLRDRIWFCEKEKSSWMLDGEPDLINILHMAELWLEKYDDYLIGDNRRNQGRIRISASMLHTIVTEVNLIPLNLGSPSIKINRIYSQVEDWMRRYYPLIKRCRIECHYTPPYFASTPDVTPPVKISDLSIAVTSADSDLPVDLEEVVKMKELIEKAQIWIEKACTLAPKRNARKKKRAGIVKDEKQSMTEITALVNESLSIPVDINDELDRLKMLLSVTQSWRLQAQSTLREITLAFEDFRKERVAFFSCSLEGNKSPSEAALNSVDDWSVSKPDNVQIETESLTQRSSDHHPSKNDSLTTDNTVASGSATPTFIENGEKNVFSLVAIFLRNVKTLNIITPEETAAEELSNVTSWFTKVFKLINCPSEAFERKNFTKLDKLVESGQELLKPENMLSTEIPEDKSLMSDLRNSWASAMKDDIERLLDLRRRRGEFLEWCERAGEIISSADKKIPIETLKELAEQSAIYPSCSEVVMRVRKRTKDSIAWLNNAEDIIKSGRKISLEEAKELTDEGEKLGINCQEYKTLRNALRLTRGWLLRVKKCGAADGHTHIVDIKELIKEHNSFIVTAMDEVAKLKQVMCGYCICRQPYEGFMIGCDGCGEWYHGPCIGISEEQAEKFDKYVCVRCSTLRVYKENAASVAGIIRKWTSAKGLAKARSMDSQRYGRKVRQAERDIAKSKSDLEKYERELHTANGYTNGSVTSNVASSSLHLHRNNLASKGTAQDCEISLSLIDGAKSKGRKADKELRDKIEKARSTIENCEKRMEGYKVELIERKNLEAMEDASSSRLKKWCNMVKRIVLSPSTKEGGELSRPRGEGHMSGPMERTQYYAETLGIIEFPDVDSVLNSFKIFSWCLRSLDILMRKPRIEEVRALLSHSDNDYFKLPEAKCVRMLRSMVSRAAIWQAKVKKALMPIPGEKRPFDVVQLKDLLAFSKQIPLTMPEELRLWNTIEDNGSRHCICGGPSDGSFMLGCDNCDQWFHGSCVKLDKEACDALSKWICPPCSNSTSLEPLCIETRSPPPSDKKPHGQETKVPPQDEKYDDISPHAPNPISLWPPFGLRDSNEAIDVLGKPGDSDNEDIDFDNLKQHPRILLSKTPKDQNWSRTASPLSKKKSFSACSGKIDASFTNSPPNNVLLVASVASLAAPIVPDYASSQDNAIAIAEAARGIALLNADTFNKVPAMAPPNVKPESQSMRRLSPTNCVPMMTYRDQPSNHPTFAPKKEWDSSNTSQSGPAPVASTPPFSHSLAATSDSSSIYPLNTPMAGHSSNVVSDQSMIDLTDPVDQGMDGNSPIASTPKSLTLAHFDGATLVAPQMPGTPNPPNIKNADPVCEASPKIPLSSRGQHNLPFLSNTGRTASINKHDARFPMITRSPITLPSSTTSPVGTEKVAPIASVASSNSDIPSECDVSGTISANFPKPPFYLHSKTNISTNTQHSQYLP